MTTQEGPKRVWIDGCYDMWHYGHCNAIKQATRAEPLTITVVGVHSDKEIELAKGSPVMHNAERESVVRACRWVDEMIVDAPYTTSLATMRENKIDICVHGEDITYGPNGEDSYQEVKDAGMFRLIKRTKGISTTDIIDRVLNGAKHHKTVEEAIESMKINIDYMTYSFSRGFHQFAVRPPTTTDRVVFVPGSFDMFHISHVQLLEQAKSQGAYVIVGLFSDEVIHQIQHLYYPVCNIAERAPVVTACKYVDAIIVGVPEQITQEFLEAFSISSVLHCASALVEPVINALPKYLAVPQEQGILTSFYPQTILSTERILNRIVVDRERFQLKTKMSRDKLARCPALL